MNEIKEYLLIDDEYFDKLIEKINHAKRLIFIEMYIFNNDILGKKVMSALVSAALKGVQVKIVVDGIGSSNWSNRITHELERSNIQSKIYHPIPWHFAKWRKSTKIYTSILNQISFLFANINKRNHRKVCIVDDDVFIGSCNISASHLRRSRGGDNWHDISIMLSGANISELIYSFERIWGAVPIRARIKRAVHKAVIDPIFRLNDTFRQRHIYKKTMLDDLAKCKKRIWIMNSYFVPDQEILNILVKAAQNNIDVRMILPSKTDVFIVSLVSKTFYHLLIKSGVMIYEYEPGILHAKVLILDDEVYIGSSNLNHRSLRHDLELDVRVQSKETIQAINNIFLHDFSISKLITTEDIFKQPLLHRLFGRLLLYIKYWL